MRLPCELMRAPAVGLPCSVQFTAEAEPADFDCGQFAGASTAARAHDRSAAVTGCSTAALDAPDGRPWLPLRFLPELLPEFAALTMISPTSTDQGPAPAPAAPQAPPGATGGPPPGWAAGPAAAPVKCG